MNQSARRAYTPRAHVSPLRHVCVDGQRALNFYADCVTRYFKRDIYIGTQPALGVRNGDFIATLLRYRSIVSITNG